MNIRSLLAAPIAVLLAVLSLAAVRSNVDIARPAMAAPLVLRPGLSISTLPVRQVHPSAADLREAAMLPDTSGNGRLASDSEVVLGTPASRQQALASTLTPVMPYYAFAPHLLTAAKD
ncbi:hypothetical protein ACYJW8_06580 [Frateuria aurantia]